MAVSEIKNMITKHRVVIYSRKTCPFSRRAIAAIETLGVPYKVIELDDSVHSQNLLKALHDLTEGQTLPRVFVDGKFIGGGEKTVALVNAGHLNYLKESDVSV